MARLTMGNLLYPAGVGAVSAGAELFSQNHVAHPPASGPNDLIANAGMAVDFILPVAAVLNHVTDAVVKGEASNSLLAASIAIGMRRGTTFIGHKILKLRITPSPAAPAGYRANRGGAPRARQTFDRVYEPGRVETTDGEGRLPISYSVT